MDIMMPHLDGLETARRIREGSIVPIIILTALGEEADKVRAFDYGADDYLTKPFGVGELMGRVKAVLRSVRAGQRQARWRNESSAGRSSVDLERHEVTVREEVIDLTPTEFNLLGLL
jgi:two-component system, OmpR family, KDP operon response regulator KdpE